MQIDRICRFHRPIRAFLVVGEVSLIDVMIGGGNDDLVIVIGERGDINRVTIATDCRVEDALQG